MNILLPDGHAVVADFGIAKALSEATGPGLTGTGIALGTPGYMSPEQASGLAAVDERTDVYSLAIVTYEMLVGRPPGHWITDGSLRAGRFVEASPEHRLALDRLPASLEHTIVRALALRPESRFATPGEFATGLADAEEAAGVPSVEENEAAAPLPAAPELDAAPIPVNQAQVALAGAPTLLAFERVIEGEVPASEYPTLIEEIRATFGKQGYHTGTPRSFMWTARPPEKPFALDVEKIIQSAISDSGPRISIRVSSRSGRTRIRVEQHLGEVAGGIYGGVVGGGGGGIATTVLVVGLLAVSTPVVPTVVAALGGLGGMYWLARLIYRSVADGRAATLENLLERLTEHCRETAI